jgi:hypothetical protein
MKSIALLCSFLSAPLWASALEVKNARGSYDATANTLTVEVENPDVTGRLVLKVSALGMVESANPLEVVCSTYLKTKALLVGKFDLKKPIREVLARVGFPPADGYDLLINIIDYKLVRDLLEVVTEAPGERGWHYFIKTPHLIVKRMQSFAPDFGVTVKVRVDAAGNVFAGLQTP